jgi:Bacterial SH3 domain
LLHRLQAIGLTLWVMTTLVACGINAESGPSTVVITLPPTKTLDGNIRSMTPRLTATLIPSITPTPSITPPASETPLPPTDTPTPPPPPTAAVRGTVKFNSPAVNLREGPGENFKVLQPVRAGTPLTVIGLNEAKTWYIVQLDGGTEGWLLADLVIVANETPIPVFSAADLTQRAVQATQVASSGGTPGPGQVVGGPTRVPGVHRQGDVLAYCDSKTNGEPPSTFTAGTAVTIYWSWFAKEPVQLADHVDYAEYDVRVDGQPLSNWQDFKSSVLHSTRDGNYYVYWYVPIGSPPPGKHTIEYKLTWKQKISDGFKTFGPGGDEESNTGSCVFTIQ